MIPIGKLADYYAVLVGFITFVLKSLVIIYGMFNFATLYKDRPDHLIFSNQIHKYETTETRL